MKIPHSPTQNNWFGSLAKVYQVHFNIYYIEYFDVEALEHFKLKNCISVHKLLLNDELYIQVDTEYETFFIDPDNANIHAMISLIREIEPSFRPCRSSEISVHDLLIRIDVDEALFFGKPDQITIN